MEFLPQSLCALEHRAIILSIFWFLLQITECKGGNGLAQLGRENGTGAHWEEKKLNHGTRKTALREKQAETVLCHIWEDMTNKAGFIPESCGRTHRFIMKQLEEEPVLALRECGKQTRSWEGFHFRVEQSSELQVLLTFRAWEVTFSTESALKAFQQPPPKKKAFRDFLSDI